MANLTHGMNLEQVEELGRFLKARGADLERMASEVERRVAVSAWAGTDADRYRDDWWPKHKASVLGIAEAIIGLGQAALNNASAQRDASEDRGTRSNPDRPQSEPLVRSAERPAASDGGVGSPTGKLPGADRTAAEVDAEYRRASGLGSHNYGNKGYEYQCTAWAKFRWQELGYDGDLSGAMGNGKDMAGRLGGSTTTEMGLGAIVSSPGTNSNPYGHVMIVEEISNDGVTARVSEWNTESDGEVGRPEEFRNNKTLSKGSDGLWRTPGGQVVTIANLP